jgi:hypothetical protein
VTRVRGGVHPAPPDTRNLTRPSDRCRLERPCQNVLAEARRPERHDVAATAGRAAPVRSTGDRE